MFSPGDITVFVLHLESSRKFFRSAHVSCPLQCQCHPVSFLSKALCSSKIFLNSHFFLSVPIRIFVTFYITENILLFLWHASFKVDDSTVLPESPVCDWKSNTWVFYWLHISGSKLPTWPIKKQKKTHKICWYFCCFFHLILLVAVTSLGFSLFWVLICVLYCISHPQISLFFMRCAYRCSFVCVSDVHWAVIFKNYFPLNPPSISDL